MNAEEAPAEDFSFLALPHDQGEFRVLPARGRIHGLSYKDTEAIWRPEVIDSWNIGGDRLWIAPERDWHWSDVSSFDLDNYLVAEEIDPGSWQVARQSASTLTVAQSFTVRHRRRSAYVTGAIERSFEFNAEARHTLPGLEDSVTWNTVDTLEIKAGTPGQGINLWRILQVPVGGEMFVPAQDSARYRLHFGDESGLVTPASGGIAASITGNHMYKIGMGQNAVRDCIAYARSLAHDTLLVIARWFETPADAVYLDTPMDRPDTPGDIIQIYNDNGVFGGFGELEVHGPGLRVQAESEFPECTRVTDMLTTSVGIMSSSDWQIWKEGGNA